MNKAIKKNDPTRYESEIKGAGYKRASERMIDDKLKEFSTKIFRNLIHML